ncbi:MAG: hemolysin III family protein [Methylobacter sp.]|jgi:channel protein (hemolysin III family)|uniref:PAQR family membrane homeostasis protein TrhA n=1 Tax=Methylobacter sp. TaxID=2051955 RepID=UPI0025E8040C|nr:hemolysin III family protein [Methylobacter sp.]MCK9621643.1 hemolysin III family protein [Methylobacter sp.]
MSGIYPILGFTHPLSSIIHLLGAVFFTYQAKHMLRRVKGSSIRTISLAVFSGSCIFLLLVSGVYHLLATTGVAHTVFQRLDHAAIFLVIAGTFTPINCILFTGLLRWGFLVTVWVLAISGLIVKTIFFTTIPEWLGLSFYLGLGWMGLFMGFHLWRDYGFAFIQPLVLGGIFYTVGAIIEYHQKLTIVPGIIGPHEILHIAVLLGIGFQWWFIVKALEQTPSFD